ncbi:MAG TPA: hypothetical protein ENN29_12045 [Candidatus Hydrogenedentes bacterium]|nr:hypothetical protein [Candidatus Hydrogenedentota bacterium]
MADAEHLEQKGEGASIRMSPRRALAISLATPLFLYLLLLVMLGDNIFPFSGSPQGREHRAALAIRDNVTPFLQWSTRLFTQPYLQQRYAEYWYFTQQSEDHHKDEFIASLEHALAAYPSVDLYLLAHTNKYVNWVETIPELLRQRIRFVYNTGCYNKKQGQDWLALGANAYIGHPGKSLSPFFYFFLLRHWTRGGTTLSETLELGNRRMERKFSQLEFYTLGRFDAARAMYESVASLFGDATLRMEDMP